MKKKDNRTAAQIEVARQKAELRKSKRVACQMPRNRKDGGSVTVQETLK